VPGDRTGTLSGGAWGGGVWETKEVLAEVSVIDFLGLRYGLGTLVTGRAMYPHTLSL